MKTKHTESQKAKNQKGSRERGLNPQEKIRLAQIKRTLGGNEAKKEKPDTAQKTITFERMLPDGTCRVSENYYTRMIEFHDINYNLLEEDDKVSVLDEYADLVDSFDASSRFGIFLFNRRADRAELASRLEIQLKGDAADALREEYSGILGSQAAKGGNAFAKSKYLFFGVEAKDGADAAAELNRIEKNALERLESMGTHPSQVKGRERLRLLHEYFNQDGEMPFTFSTFKEMKAAGRQEKDYVAPTGFDFRSPSRFRTGKMHGRAYYVGMDFAPKMSDDILGKLLDIDGCLSVTMHMQSYDAAKATKLVKGKLSSIQKSKIDFQKKAVRDGYDMDILPPDVAKYEKATLELLDDLGSSSQKLIKLTMIIVCYGRTQKEMDDLSGKVRDVLQPANLELRPLQYLQEQGLMAAAPIGCNDVGIERTVNTKVAAVLVPFCTRELFMPPPAVYYGLNAISGNMIMADRRKLRTPNGVILGTPGSGKSFSAKREILSCLLATDDDVIICDPEGEYYPLVAALDGAVVRLAMDSEQYLNPMDIIIADGKKAKEALNLKISFIITLCDHIAGGKDGLENDEKGIIDECARAVYGEYLKNPVPDNMPMLEDLYSALLDYEPARVREELAGDVKAKATRIANSLSLYVHGSQNFFNHRTSVDSRNRLICFDIRDLSDQLKELGMLIVQDEVWGRVSQNRERGIATRYYCDEFHLLLREPQTAAYSVEIWKRFRKWGGIPTGITQNVGDFLRSPEIEGILSNSDFVYLLNQAAADQQILADKLGLSDLQLGYVTNADKGSGLIIFDDAVIPFVDRYPKETQTYALMTTNPEERRAIEENGNGGNR